MKKTIVIVLVTMIVMSIIWGTVFMKVNRKHNEELDNLKAEWNSISVEYKSEFNELQRDYTELFDRNQDLEENVYKYMETKEPYEITVHHGDETHQWYATKRGFFGEAGHIVCH